MRSARGLWCSALLLAAACSSEPAAVAPADDPRRAEVLAVCTRFLDDYSSQRWDAVAAALAPGAVSAHVTASQHRASRVAVQPMTEFLDRAKPALAQDPEFHEWISAEPTVLMEGDIATVWAPFRVRSRHGCGGGIDAFHLARVSSGWKIVALCDVFRPDPK